MKKNTFFLAGLPVIALALGMMVAGCDDGSSGGDDSAKQIQITGLPENTSKVQIQLMSRVDDSGERIVVAEGSATEISEESATISLEKKYGSQGDFTGRGLYVLELKIESDGDSNDDDSNDDDSKLTYTNGSSVEELKLSGETDPKKIFSKLPKYKVSAALSTIAYDKFVDLEQTDE